MRGTGKDIELLDRSWQTISKRESLGECRQLQTLSRPAVADHILSVCETAG